MPCRGPEVVAACMQRARPRRRSRLEAHRARALRPDPHGRLAARGAPARPRPRRRPPGDRRHRPRGRGDHDRRRAAAVAVGPGGPGRAGHARGGRSSCVPSRGPTSRSSSTTSASRPSSPSGALREARMKREARRQRRRQGRGRGDAPVLARERTEMNGGESTATTGRRRSPAPASACWIVVVACSSLDPARRVRVDAARGSAWQLDPPGQVRRDGRGARRRRVERRPHRRRARRPRRHRLLARVQRLLPPEEQLRLPGRHLPAASATWECSDAVSDARSRTAPRLHRARGAAGAAGPARSRRGSASSRAAASDAFLAAVRSGAKRSKYQPAGNTSLEGLLWPDTYRVADTDDEIDVLGSMVSEFEQHADAARARRRPPRRAARPTRSSRSRR